MNIWDSVHRGLEKASNEAGRIAKAQRLRSSIDKLGRQVGERETALVNTIMHIFNTGGLVQTELQPLCQELVQLRQQIAQIHMELQQMNTQPPQVGAGFPGSQTGGLYNETPTVFPPDHPYADSSTSPSTAPPPPGMTHMSIPPPPPGFQGPGPNFQETQMAQQSVITTCPQCGKQMQAINAFCQNCGAPLAAENINQPTMRAENSSTVPQTENNATRTDISQVPPERI